MPGRGVESLGKGAGALKPLLPGPGGLWPAGVRPSWCDHSPPAALPPRGAKVRRPPALRKDHPITNTNQAAPPARLAAVVRPFGAAAGARCPVLLRGRRGARGPPLVRGVRRLPCRKKKRCPPAVRPAAAVLGAAALGLCPGVRVCAPVRAHGRPCGFAVARPRLPPLRVRAVVRLAWGSLVPSGAKGTGKGPPWMAMPAKETTWPPGSCLRHTRFLRKPK